MMHACVRVTASCLHAITTAGTHLQGAESLPPQMVMSGVPCSCQRLGQTVQLVPSCSGRLQVPNYRHGQLSQRCTKSPCYRTLAIAAAGPSARSGLQSKDNFRYLELELPPPVNSRIAKSAFVKSSAKVGDCPPSRGFPEFAVIGRSNVGKSSLINSLTGNDKLAKVSKEPGATKLINHFLINDAWFLVDLPGYGFSKTASKAAREEWLAFTKDFFISRDTLAHVLLLVDCSLPPQQVDIDCANWLAECEVPFAIVFTKADAKKKEGPSPAANIKAFKQMLAADWEALPWCFETSSRTGQGKTELLGYLASVREMYRRTGGQ